MSWHIYDENGERAQKLTVWEDDLPNTLGAHNRTTRGWHAAPPARHTLVVGFLPERGWRPTFFAAKMARGYRLFRLDVGEYLFATAFQAAHWWQPASPDQKRFPNIGSLEMWIRTVGVNQ